MRVKFLFKPLKAVERTALISLSAASFTRGRECPIKRGDPTIGPRTINQYHETIRSFCRWCVKRKRMATNPMAGMEQMDETADIRRARRALTAEQLASLLGVASEHHQLFYRMAMATGTGDHRAEKFVSEFVSSPSAGIEYCSASIGKITRHPETLLTLADGNDGQQKTPSGGDGELARQVGLEPTTFPLTAGCSTIELLPKG